MEAIYPSLRDKNVVVVGTGGIGGAIVKDYLEQGSRVFALDKNIEILNKLYNSLDKDDKLEIYQIDVTDYDNYEKVLKEIGNNHKQIKSFVHTVGIGELTPVGKTPHELSEDLFKLNVLSFIDGVNTIQEYMKKGSSITIISSINAYRPEPGMSVYDSTKAALLQYSRTAAADLGKRGIRVNAVAPGYIRTPQTIEELKNTKTKKRIENATVLGCIGEPEDVSPVVIALASDDFGFITGTYIEISGGLALAQYLPIEKQKNI